MNQAFQKWLIFISVNDLNKGLGMMKPPMSDSAISFGASGKFSSHLQHLKEGRY
jgi:hypothetical protein